MDRDRDMQLWLNEDLETDAGRQDERGNHVAMVHLPLLYANKTENVLVIGGGDGQPARELARVSRLWQHVTVVEIDCTLLEIIRNHPLGYIMSGGSHAHPNITIVCADGLRYLLDSKPGAWDVIIDDAEVEVSV